MKVSVLVPTYNRPALLAETLESLTRQTMAPGDFEVIVVNDGGTASEVPDLPMGLQGEVVHKPTNKGLSAALNVALSMAVGEYVTVSADDDLVLPHKLLGLSVALDKASPAISATFGWPIYTDRQGNQLGCPEKVREFMRKHPVVTSEIALSEGLYVHGTAPMYRASALRQVGGWNERMPTAEEWDMNHRLLKFAGPFLAVDLPVVTYRAGGKHAQFKSDGGRRPREIMRLTYDALGAS
jgi:glycosyltransferase involved in cell wall biosynthesis